MLPENNSETLVVIGKIQRPYGLRGFIRVKPLTDWPERFRNLTRVSSLKNGTLERELYIEQVMLQPSALLIKFRGIDDCSGVEALCGMTLAIRRSECVALQDGEFYAFEVIGLKVVDVEGKELGRLADVLAYPANDVWVIRNHAKEWLIPATDEFVKKVDRAAGVIVVDRMDEFEE